MEPSQLCVLMQHRPRSAPFGKRQEHVPLVYDTSPAHRAAWKGFVHGTTRVADYSYQPFRPPSPSKAQHNEDRTLREHYRRCFHQTMSAKQRHSPDVRAAHPVMHCTLQSPGQSGRDLQMHLEPRLGFQDRGAAPLVQSNAGRMMVRWLARAVPLHRQRRALRFQRARGEAPVPR